MEASFKSGALEANLAQTRPDIVDLSERRRLVIFLSADCFDINWRTGDLFREYNHHQPH